MTTDSTRPYGGHSKTERVTERRERLLAAGLDVIGEVGLRASTVKALCKAAGLTERYFYESFTDTEDLFCAVYQQQVTRLQHTFIEALPRMGGDLDSRIQSCMTIYFHMMRDHRLVRVLYLEPVAGSTRIRELYSENVRLTGTLSAHLLRSDNPELVITESIAMGIGHALSGAASSLAVQWSLGGQAISEEDLVKSAIIVVRGTMRELAAPPP